VVVQSRTEDQPHRIGRVKWKGTIGYRRRVARGRRRIDEARGNSLRNALFIRYPLDDDTMRS
jgi:hypothetical protein